MNKPQCIVIGASAGAIDTLGKILPRLPADYPLPILIVIHLPPDKESVLPELFQKKTPLTVKEAEDKEPILPGTVYFAPADYHFLVEKNKILSLSSEEPVLFSRPSIDVMFEAAADSYREYLIGIILTGANQDGAKGLKRIKEYGGLAIVQDPATAYAPDMPHHALRSVPDALCLNVDEIVDNMLRFAGFKSGGYDLRLPL
jgi:two-component system, chemotaxis family, protein-glutamate methylesterase/glutaminase